jgi:nicotinamidase-related amidase
MSSSSFPPLTPGRTALVVYHVQENMSQFLGPARSPYLSVVRRVVTAARALRLPIMWVTVNDQIIGAHRNVFFTRIAAMFGRMTWTPEATCPPVDAGYQAGDEVAVNGDVFTAVSGKGVDSVIVCGMATSAGVLTTACASAGFDYTVTVLADGCADGDQQLHDTLVTKVFPKFVLVHSVAEFEKAAAEAATPAAQ